MPYPLGHGANCEIWHSAWPHNNALARAAVRGSKRRAPASRMSPFRAVEGAQGGAERGEGGAGAVHARVVLGTFTPHVVVPDDDDSPQWDLQMRVDGLVPPN